MPVGRFAALIVAVLTLLGIGARYGAHGDWNLIHSLLSLFCSTHLLICYWEICLFLRRDLVEARTRYWRERQERTGRVPATEFLLTRVPLTRLLSPNVWADVWATYAQFDDSYADRRTFGFNVDISSGFLTPVPTLILYAACTFAFLPAVFAGILGVILFWQLTFGALVYWVSFFVTKRQTRLSRRDLVTYILATNSFWVVGGLFGVYVSIRLIVDGGYTVLGYPPLLP